MSNFTDIVTNLTVFLRSLEYEYYINNKTNNLYSYMIGEPESTHETHYMEKNYFSIELMKLHKFHIVTKSYPTIISLLTSTLAVLDYMIK